MMPGWHCSLVDFTCVLSIAVSGTDYKTGISGKSVPCTQRTLIPLCLANLHPQTRVTVRSENICEGQRWPSTLHSIYREGCVQEQD